MSPIPALIVIALTALQQPARDPSSPAMKPTGSASITGTVVSDEPIPQPIRRARVLLASTDGTVKRGDMTDDNGAFIFRDLPPGRYSLTSSKPAWLTTNYGATRPKRPGTPIALADGARLTGITVRMARGAVITGIVSDGNGQPMPGVRLQVSRIVVRNGENTLEPVAAEVPDAIETDDSGTYRIFGLPPGNVIISASVRPTVVARTEPAVFGRISADDFRRASDLVRQGGAPVTVSAAPVRPAMAFYPGTTDPSGATVLTIAAGEVHAGIDFVMPLVPTSNIEGIVTDQSGVPLRRATVMAVSGGLQFLSVMGSNGVTTSNTDADGHYRLTGLAPGEYSLLATAAQALFAETSVTVNGQDLNVPLSMQPLLSLSGRVVFDGAASPPPAQGFRCTMSATSTASLLAQSATSAIIDGAFTASIVPGRYRLAFSGVPDGWYVKSAMVDGENEDLLDQPITVRPGDRRNDVIVTLTDKPSELTGSFVDAAGRPAAEYFVVVFSTDRQFWTQPSRRIVQVRPGSDGAYSLKGLPAGEYFITALTDIDPGESLTPELLESIVASAPVAKVTVGDGQRTVQTLKIGGASPR